MVYIPRIWKHMRFTTFSKVTFIKATNSELPCHLTRISSRSNSQGIVLSDLDHFNLQISSVLKITWHLLLFWLVDLLDEVGSVRQEYTSYNNFVNDLFGFLLLSLRGGVPTFLTPLRQVFSVLCLQKMMWVFPWCWGRTYNRQRTEVTFMLYFFTFLGE